MQQFYWTYESNHPQPTESEIAEGRACATRMASEALGCADVSLTELVSERRDQPLADGGWDHIRVYTVTR